MLMKCGYREKIDFARWEVVMILSVLASVSLIISLRLLLVLMSILFLSGGRVEFRMLRLRFGSVDLGRPASALSARLVSLCRQSPQSADCFFAELLTERMNMFGFCIHFGMTA